MTDEVRVYNRPLAAAEITEHFQREAGLRVADPAFAFRPLREGKQIPGEGFGLQALADGAMQIDVAGDSYLLESSFSYSGEKIGWNWLGQTRETCETAWRPKVSRIGENRIRLDAQGARHSLVRQVKVRSKS